MLKLHCSLVQLPAGGKDVMQSICYDAGNISIATRIANMMTARIVTVSKKLLPCHQLQHRLTAGSITVTCDDVHTAQLNQNEPRLSVCNSLHIFVILEALSLTQSAMVAQTCLKFINDMSPVVQVINLLEEGY